MDGLDKTYAGRETSLWRSSYLTHLRCHSGKLCKVSMNFRVGIRVHSCQLYTDNRIMPWVLNLCSK